MKSYTDYLCGKLLLLSFRVYSKIGLKFHVVCDLRIELFEQFDVFELELDCYLTMFL